MNKKILLSIIAIIAVLAIGSVAFSLGIFGLTTEVNTKFLSGIIQGEAIENNINIILPSWEVNYNDAENGIDYSFIMTDSLNMTIDSFIHMAGVKKIDTKEYNGNKWEIYYLDADSAYNISKNNVEFTLNQSGYLCVASGENGYYGITISSNKKNVSSDNSLNSELFKNYVEPLLKSLTLKDPKNPPKEYQFLNMTKEEYNLTKKYIKENGWDTVINNM